MNEPSKEDIVWPTIFEIGGAIIGIAIVVGAATQIYKRFHAHKRANIAIFIEQAEASKPKSKTKPKTKDS